jgi:hypothetical protein
MQAGILPSYGLMPAITVERTWRAKGMDVKEKRGEP